MTADSTEELEEAETSLQTLHNRKASGSDGINGELLKYINYLRTVETCKGASKIQEGKSVGLSKLLQYKLA